MEHVRSLLDENGYREPLAVEALPLTKHLLLDLLATMKQLEAKSAQLQHFMKNNEDLSVATACYKEENGHFLSDNNELHMKNLKLKELNEAEKKDHKNAIRKLENDHANLIFLVEELKRQLAQVESDSYKKSQKILHLQEGNPTNYDMSNRQKIQMDSVLTIKPRCKVKCAQCGCAWRSRSHDVYTADLLHLTNEKVNKLHGEIDSQADAIKRQELECSHLHMQVKSREGEIERLKALLEGGRSVGAILEDNKLRVAHSRLHEFQIQLEISEKNREQLIAKLDAVKGENKMAKSRAMKLADENEDLTAELQNAESTNRIMEHDCNTASSVLKEKLSKIQNELSSCETNLSDQHRLFHLIKKERDQLKEDLSMLGQDHSFLLNERKPLLCDNRKMEGVLKKGQEEKKHMIDKMNHLTVHLQESEGVKQTLQVEVSALQSDVTGLDQELKAVQSAKESLRKQEAAIALINVQLEAGKCQLERKLAKLTEEKCRIEDDRNALQIQLSESQKDKQSVEQARDYYSDDVAKLNTKLEKLQKEQTSCVENMTKMELERNDFQKEKTYYSEQVAQLLKILKTPPSTSKIGIGKKPEEDIGQLRYEREVLQQERNYYKMQWQSLKNRGASPPLKTPVQSPPSERPKIRKPLDDDKDVDIETLIAEKNFMRDQMNHFQHLYNDTKIKLLQQPVQTGSAPGSVERDSKDSELNALRRDVHMREDEKNFFMEQYEKLKNMMAASGDQEESLDAETLLIQNRTLEAEKSFYMNKYKDLASKTAQYTISSSGKRPVGKEEIAEFLAGKRALLISNAELEAQVENLQEELKEVRSENINIVSTNKSLSTAVDSLQQTASQKFPPSMQAFIAEIRKNRDAAVDELSKIKDDRDAMRTKMQVATVQQRKDKVTAQENLSALQQEQEETEDDAAQMRHRLDVQAVLVTSLQQQSEDLKSALMEARDELGRSNKQSGKIKKLLSTKVVEIGSQEQQMEHRIKQLTEAGQSIAQLQTQLEESAQRIVQLEAERDLLLQNLGSSDKDKNLLNSDLSSKAQIIATLGRESKDKTVIISELEGTISKLERQIQTLEVNLESENRRLADETERNQRYQQDLAVTTEQKDAANKEIRRLQKEIVCLTRDISELQGELEKTKAVKESFKLKAQEYCRTLEELGLDITEKEKEQESLVQQYLSLNETLSSLKTVNASLEESAASQTKQITKLEVIIQEGKLEREEIFEQMNGVSKRNNELETVVHRLEEEKFTAEKDLLGSRDTIQKFESRKVETDSETKRLSSALDKILEQKNSAEGDLASVSEQLLSERTAVRSLEELLAEKRKNEFMAESSLKQLEVEKVQLQRKITELKEQHDDELSENRRLRSRVAQTELDLERLRRDVTNEQYERERISQQLRRVEKFANMSDALSAIDSKPKENKTSCRTAEYVTSASYVACRTASVDTSVGISRDSTALESGSGAVAYLDSEQSWKIPLNTGAARHLSSSGASAYHARLYSGSSPPSKRLSSASSAVNDSINRTLLSRSFSTETYPTSQQTPLIQNVRNHPAASGYPGSLYLHDEAELPFYAASIMTLSQAFNVREAGLVQDGRPPSEFLSDSSNH